MMQGESHWGAVVGKWTYQTEAESDRSLDFKESSLGKEKAQISLTFIFLGGLCRIVRYFQEQSVE